MGIVILRYIFLFVACQQSNDTVKIEIIENESGWYYIVPSDTIDNVSIEKLKTNTDGVSYINANHYNKLKSIVVYKDGLDVTNSIRFLSKLDHDIFIDGARKRYHLMKFYLSINENSECCSEPNRNDPDTHLKYSKIEKLHRSRLIQEGKIRFK